MVGGSVVTGRVVVVSSSVVVVSKGNCSSMGTVVGEASSVLSPGEASAASTITTAAMPKPMIQPRGGLLNLMGVLGLIGSPGGSWLAGQALPLLSCPPMRRRVANAHPLSACKRSEEVRLVRSFLDVARRSPGRRTRQRLLELPLPVLGGRLESSVRALLGLPAIRLGWLQLLGWVLWLYPVLVVPRIIHCSDVESPSYKDRHDGERPRRPAQVVGVALHWHCLRGYALREERPWPDQDKH